MGSASREALAHAKQALHGVLEERAGADLLVISGGVQSSSALQAVLTDASVETVEKIRLVENIFGSASFAAKRVLEAAISERWSNASDLIAGLEELGIRAEATLHSDLADELLTIATTIESSHDLELALGSKLGDVNAKIGIIDSLFASKVSQGALSIIKHLVSYPRGRRVNTALRESARMSADQGGSELATVTVASKLTPAQQEKLASLLTQSAGRPVRVTTVIDESLIGGVRVQIGDDVIDGTVKSRLEDLRLQLAS